MPHHLSRFIPNSPSPLHSRPSLARHLASFVLVLLVWVTVGSAWAGPPSWQETPSAVDSQNQSEVSPVLVCDSQGQNCGSFNKGRALGCGGTYTLKGPDGRAYNWQLSGGGTLNASSGASVTLTAPASNAGCSGNGTLQMIDPATGLVVASIRTTFVCGVYGPGGSAKGTPAYGSCTYHYSEWASPYGTACQFFFLVSRYNCSGDFIDTRTASSYYYNGASEHCMRNRAPADMCKSPNYDPCCQGFIDYRSSAMTQGGCCPEALSPSP